MDAIREFEWAPSGRATWPKATHPKLHIGCGVHMLTGWLNTDYEPELPMVMHLDASQHFPFKEATFDYVFSEHVIEHILYWDGMKMLAECFRVLKGSGKMRISTPDLAFLIDLTRPDKSDLQRAYIKWAANAFTPGAPDDNEAFVINNFVRNWGHTFIYDEKTLRGAMASAGFRTITKCDLYESTTLLCAIWKMKSTFRKTFCVWKRSRSKARNNVSAGGIQAKSYA